MTTISNYKRIIIFGSPGSGKSTLALRLSSQLNIPVYHLDAYYYLENWVPRPKEDFTQSVLEIMGKDEYIIDGNCARIMLEQHVSSVDLIIYLDVPRWICLWRVIKRYWSHTSPAALKDRAPGCEEKLDWYFLSHHLWTYKLRQEPRIQACMQKYPHIKFMHIKNRADFSINDL